MRYCYSKLTGWNSRIGMTGFVFKIGSTFLKMFGLSVGIFGN